MGELRADGLIHVIDFQGSRWGDGFTINAAVFIRERRRSGAPVDEAHVREVDCPFNLRWRIGELGPRRGDKWWSYDAPDDAVAEIVALLTKHVLPHLRRYESRARIRSKK